MQEEEHGDEEEKDGVLHEETFHRNPSLKLPEPPSRLEMAERTAVHIWHRLPLLQVGLNWEQSGLRQTGLSVNKERS